MSKHKRQERQERHEPARRPSTPWVSLVLRVLLGAVFVLSGFSKAVYPPEAFAAGLDAYKLFPDMLLMPIAIIQPWVELIFGAFLISGYYTQACLDVFMAMIGVFMLSLLSVMSRKIDMVSCGCFGAYGPHFTPPQEFFLNCMLMIVSVVLWMGKSHPYSLDNWFTAQETEAAVPGNKVQSRR